MKLHIGGEQPKKGWKILNIQPGPHVDFVGGAHDLSAFADGSVETVYASHVLEHLGYQKELPAAIDEYYRVLQAGGRLMISVPNLLVLCQLFLVEDLNIDQRYQLMRIMFGGQIDEFDFHKVGLTEEFLTVMLNRSGFVKLERVEDLGQFDDDSKLRLGGHLISVNMVATK